MVGISQSNPWANAAIPTSWSASPNTNLLGQTIAKANAAVSMMPTMTALSSASTSPVINNGFQTVGVQGLAAQTGETAGLMLNSALQGMTGSDSPLSGITSWATNLLAKYQVRKASEEASGESEEASESTELLSESMESTPESDDSDTKNMSVDKAIDKAIQILIDNGMDPSKISKKDIQTIIKHESSGNPKAVNRKDSNAKKGTPSKGLMQTIQPTFDSNKLPGHDDILDPVDNIIAGVRYAVKTYGSTSNVPGIKKLRNGGKYEGY